MARPVSAGPAPALAFESQPDLVIADPLRRRRKASWGRILALAFVALAGAGLLAVAGYFLYPSLYRPEIDNRAFKTKGNFQMRVPGGGWQRDETVERQMRLNLAFSRSRPYAAAGLFFKDYKSRNPDNSDLFDEAMKRLRGYFEGLEYREPFESPVKESLGGQQAVVMDFVGLRDEVAFSGAVYLLAHRGYGYWFFTWGPQQEKEVLVDKFEAVRNCFSLTSNREGWQPRPRDTATFVGEKLPYQVNYVKEVWQKEDNPQDYDALCELALRGFEPLEDEETGKKKLVELAGRLATVQVLVLPKAAGLKEANEAALAHILARKKEEQDRAGLELVKDKEEKPALDRDTDVGGFRGHLSKVRIFAPVAEYERFALVGVVNQGEGVLVVFCECPWARRDYWEQEFRALMDSVRSSGRAKTTEKPQKKEAEKPKAKEPEKPKAPEPDGE